VLIDEIDKADPDVPNDLLEPLDLKAFTVRETNDPVIAKREQLLMLTTNGERELPPAFMRRCVTLRLDPPTEPWFTAIANLRFGAANAGLHAEVAGEVMRLRTDAQGVGAKSKPTEKSAIQRGSRTRAELCPMSNSLGKATWVRQPGKVSL
jgi:MoxR-like ATPase